MDLVEDFFVFAGELLARLHWGAAVLTVAAALLWTRILRPPRLSSWGFWAAITAGALVAWLYADWIEPNVEAALGDLLQGLGLGSGLDPYPQLLATTLIDQILVLAALSVVYVAGQVRNQESPVLEAGQGVGIGYGAIVLQIEYSGAFAGGLTGELALAAGAGALLFAVHVCAGMLLSLARLNGAHLTRILQAGALVFLARNFMGFAEPAWEAGGLAVIALLALFFVASAATRRDWSRR